MHQWNICIYILQIGLDVPCDQCCSPKKMQEIKIYVYKNNNKRPGNNVNIQLLVIFIGKPT